MRHDSYFKFVEFCKVNFVYPDSAMFVKKIADVRDEQGGGEDWERIENRLTDYYDYRFGVSLEEINSSIIQFCVDEGLLKHYSNIFAPFNAAMYKHHITCIIWSLICIELINNNIIKSDAKSLLVWHMDRTRLSALSVIYKEKIDFGLPELISPIIKQFHITRNGIELMLNANIFDICDGFKIDGFEVKDMAELVRDQDPIY